MIPIKREDFTDDPAWVEWNKQAQKETKLMVEGWAARDKHAKKAPGSADDKAKDAAEAQIKIKTALYKAAKPFLNRLFSGKCAYCEVMIEVSHPTEVEHYRPKGNVKDENEEEVTIVTERGEEEHPGYWWLAYTWSNLLSSCIDCNRRRTHEKEEAGKRIEAKAGKADIFPVKGKRAMEPGEEDNETPLLLNPCEEHFDPIEHFTFEKDGSVTAKTERGEATLKLLGFNLREKAVARRASAYSDARSRMKTYLTALVSAPLGPDTEDMIKDKKTVNEYWEGRAEFSIFGRVALQAFMDELKNRNATIAVTLPL